MANIYNNIPDYQAEFVIYLQSEKYGNMTVKNFVFDLRQFLMWSNADTTLPNSIPTTFSIKALTSYKQYLSLNNTAQETVDRRFMAISKFCEFAIGQNWLKKNTAKAVINSKNKITNEDLISKFSLFLTNKKYSKRTVKHYLNDVTELLQIIN
jgi:site-specific recombinase XerD